MAPDPRSSVVQLATQAITSYISRREQEKMMEKRQELAQAQARALQNIDPSATSSSSDAQDATGGVNAVDTVLAEEDCPVCSAILGAVKEMDEPKRTKGVAEYGEFRRALDDGGDAATEVLENSEVLGEAVQDVRDAGELL